MKTLYICEKPSQGRDIARQLNCHDKQDGFLANSDTAVSWCFGHLIETAPPEDYCKELSNGWRIDLLPVVPKTWRYEVKKTAQKQFNVLKKLIKSAGRVVIATDADREGELIAREVLAQCSYQGEIQRLWLSALDDASIQKALADIRPGAATEALGQAGMARQCADWLIGMNMTMAATALHGKKGTVFSVGRVQTPTLRLVVARDQLIEHFVPKDYFELVAQFSTAAGESFYAKCVSLTDKSACDEEGRCLNLHYLNTFAHKVKGQPGQVTHFDDVQKHKAPPLCLSLSQLQKLASSQLGFSAQGTLDTAQKLYEKHKALSYPRTDCGYLPTSQRADIETILGLLKNHLPALASLVDACDPSAVSPVWNDKKITAHHGIIPTLNKAVAVDQMTEEECQLYELVCRYYLAQFLGNYQYAQRSVTVLCSGESFKASSHTPLQPGWKRALTALEEETDKEKEKDEEDDHLSVIPHLTVQEKVQHTEEKILSKKTRPPARFTEGTLIDAMKSIGRHVEDPRYQKILKDTAGIGTEATRAGILETLLNRKFLTKKGKTLLSTELGRLLIAKLPPMLSDPMLTAAWEQALDQVAQGQLKLESFLKQQEDLLHKMLTTLQATAKTVAATPISQGFAAPSTAISRGAGKAPEIFATVPASNARPAVTPALVAGSTTSPACDLCRQPLVRRLSRQHNTYFWGCTAFPKCRHTVRDVDGKPSMVVHAP